MIVNLYSVFSLVLSSLFLQDSITCIEGGAILFGFMGTFLVILGSPSSESSADCTMEGALLEDCEDDYLYSVGIMFSLMSAVAFSFTILYARKL